MSLPGDWIAGKYYSKSLTLSLFPIIVFFFFFSYTGRVGPPLPCNDIKLVDVAEMNYFAANGEGEVGSARVLSWPGIIYLYRTFDIMLNKSLLVGVHQRTKCIQRIPEWSRENSRSAWQRWMAAHWRHWEMASCRQNWFSGSLIIVTKGLTRAALSSLSWFAAERHAEDHWQEEEYFQDGAGRIHRPREDRNDL